MFPEPSNHFINSTNDKISVKKRSDLIKRKDLSIREKLITDEAGPNVFNYFAEHLNINDNKVFIASTTSRFNILNIPQKNLTGIVNLKKVNDFRFINKFFEAVNEKLQDAGIYIGCVETNKQRYHRIEGRYPAIIRSFIIFMDFCFNRIIPKISFLKGIYFNITGGIKRSVSKAEVLGRLVSCGFEIIEYKEINNLSYFVAIKTGLPDLNLYPSYGPLYKIPRIGQNGKMIYVYKFRTMHPFSEYLQDYVLRLNGYPFYAKTTEDFRLTEWGKFIRRFWLDEMPQLINVLKGEMNLIGVQPLSQSVFEEYPEDLKKIRIKYKPGFINPNMALLKNGTIQSIEAERIYLNEKEKNPFFTDIKYLGLAVYNIITNKIRST